MTLLSYLLSVGLLMMSAAVTNVKAIEGTASFWNFSRGCPSCATAGKQELTYWGSSLNRILCTFHDTDSVTVAHGYDFKRGFSMKEAGDWCPSCSTFRHMAQGRAYCGFNETGK